jgi:hypothetical protein
MADANMSTNFRNFYCILEGVSIDVEELLFIWLDC